MGNRRKMRKACVGGGHRWVEQIEGWRPAIQTCSRLRCRAWRADPELPEPIRRKLEAMEREFRDA